LTFDRRCARPAGRSPGYSTRNHTRPAFARDLGLDRVAVGLQRFLAGQAADRRHLRRVDVHAHRVQHEGRVAEELFAELVIGGQFVEEFIDDLGREAGRLGHGFPWVIGVAIATGQA